jgi:hypothetical protein
MGVLSRILGRGREPERNDPWQMLVAVSESAAQDADAFIAHVVGRAVPELSPSSPVVRLDYRKAPEAFESMLRAIEAKLETLCGRYDYRQLLFISRLCVGLPILRSRDPNTHFTRMRSQNADRWVLRCGDRALERDYMRIEEGGYSLGHAPDTIFRDAVKVHQLANLHQRLCVERMMFNLMRLVSSENRLPGSKLRFNADGRIDWDFESIEVQGLAHLFAVRYSNYNGTLAWWGIDEFDPRDEPLALAYAYFERVRLDEPYAGGTLFLPVPFWLNALLEYGERFSALFERDIGMPVEHLRAISRALSQMSLEVTLANEGELAEWGGYTGTLLVGREVLLGGALEDAARRELAQLYPGREVDGDLGKSVCRFVDLASSSSSRRDAEGRPRGTRLARGQRRAAESARTVAYPYMIHGSHSHDLWVVDYLMTQPFFQGLVSELQISESKSTTGRNQSDALVRTSMFDARLAEVVGRIPGGGFAFPQKREDPDLPNVKFYFDGGSQNREIDVPVRVGEVLVAVQTWAREVDLRISEGDHGAMKRRWRSVKDKLRSTDKRYTDYLLGRPDGRRELEAEGLRYVLPVLCGPYTEPVASLKPEFWLRGPNTETSDEVVKAVPRVLTPPELTHFLATATEAELKEICKRNGWFR